MSRLVCAVVLTAACLAMPAGAEERFHWTGIDRIVAIGDLHGDWDHYIETLQAAGLVDERDRWVGGTTHLVQTGDIPDRGPDTRRIIEHMIELAGQAERDGGRLHNLIGNHEAMNVYGDLRYVVEGEFTAFADRRSARLRDRYFRRMMKNLERQDPERFAALPDDFRQQWYAEHPKGWLEHRYAWSPAWGDDGRLFEWVMDAQVSVQLNDTLFVHGGLSGFYCKDSLESLTERARDELRSTDSGSLDLVVDPFGPLWYRGLSGVAPEATEEAVAALLARHGAKRIAVGHTPTGGLIWPRYDARVLQIDTGISAAYGGNVGYLEIVEDGAFAGYRNGRVRLPEGDEGVADYIAGVVSLHADNDSLKRRASELEAGMREREPVDTDDDAVVVPTCGSRR